MILLGTGGALIIIGLVMTGVRCCCMHYDAPDTVAVDDETPHDVVSSIDVLVQRRDTQVSPCYSQVNNIKLIIISIVSGDKCYKLWVTMVPKLNLSSIV